MFTSLHLLLVASLPALDNNTVPAAVVLRKIATIINADAHPLPYPYRNIKQKAVVHQDDYKLEVGTRLFASRSRSTSFWLNPV